MTNADFIQYPKRELTTAQVRRLCERMNRSPFVVEVMAGPQAGFRRWCDDKRRWSAQINWQSVDTPDRVYDRVWLSAIKVKTTCKPSPGK